MPSILLSDNGVSSGSAGLKTTAASDGALALQTTTAGGTATTAVTIDTSQNVGLGVTPSAWDSTYKALQVGSRSMFYGIGSEANMANNAYYNAGYKYVANSAAGLYTIDANVHKWYNAASGTAGNTISFTQAMTLDASGNLLVGGTAQVFGEKLLLKTASGDCYTTMSNGTGSVYVGWSSGGVGFMGTATNHAQTFYTNGSERARIASGGQFCVNTTNTNGAFNVSGNVYLFSQSAGAGTHFLKWNSGTGQVTYDSSSRLVKDNIVDSPYGLAEIMQLKSRKYLRIDDQRDEIGLIADEVQAVMPEFVPMSQKSIFTGDKADTELVPSGVYYEKLSSVLIKAIQEQQALIASQSEIITQLQADVQALKGNA